MKTESYFESYKGLYHGTTMESADKILHEGFNLSTSNKLLGPGIYFYDIRKKAAWWASQTCRRKQESDKGELPKQAVLSCNINKINCDMVMDLRDYKEVVKFGVFADEYLKSHVIEIEGNEEFSREERIRSLLIATYADENNKKIIIGNLKQRSRDRMEEGIKIADKYNLIVGAETIYCVTDPTIIENLELSKF